jgi:hypothetical protein
MSEGFIPVNGSGGNSAPFGGRRGRSHKKLRLVKKKTVKRILAAKGYKMRGAGEGDAPAMGGRRRRGSRRSTRRRRSLFGMMKY